METECNGMLPFLGIQLLNPSPQIKTKVYVIVIVVVVIVIVVVVIVVVIIIIIIDEVVTFKDSYYLIKH